MVLSASVFTLAISSAPSVLGVVGATPARPSVGPGPWAGGGPGRQAAAPAVKLAVSAAASAPPSSPPLTLAFERQPAISPAALGLPLPTQYLHNGQVDQGVDYLAPGGTPLYAMGPGVIIQEGGPGTSGFGADVPVLQITGGPLAGKTVYYGHAGPDLVPVGTVVAAGQQISVVGYGLVGLSTAPHLEIGFWPLGSRGAGSAMLDYLSPLVDQVKAQSGG